MNYSGTFLLLFSFIMAAAAETSNAGDAQFSTRLFKQLIDAKPNGNFIVSPVSIRTGLVLTYLGADGSTAEELKQGLALSGTDKTDIAESFGKNLSKSQSESSKLTYANRIYVANKFQLNSKYQELVNKNLNAAAENVNFSENSEAAHKINAWVEQQTQQQIKNLISADSLNSDTAAVLVNAIYFKADWLNTFAELRTFARNFTVRGGQQVKVNTMYQTDFFRFAELPELKASALELRYKDTDIVFLILLPNEEQGLAALEAQLSSIDLNELSAKLSKEKVNVYLPKFQFEFDVSLQPVLEQLGMKQLFEKQANFSSLLQGADNLHISEVKHKAFIDVNEKGTTATGATYIKVQRKSLLLNEKIYQFDVKHPFFFAIKDKDNTYFLGHVNNV